MSGTFPEGLFNLPFLQVIVLSLGSLKGPLPTQLAKMDRLINFSLVHNQLSGSIPREWWSARNLRNINIGHNELTGTLPTEIENFQDLIYLRFENNSFAGTVPSELGTLDNVQVLGLNSNKFTGPIPPEIGNMDRLQELKLQSNFLTGQIPPSLGQLDNLLELHLDNNPRLTGHIPDYLFNRTTKLHTIDISDCGLSGTLSPEIAYQWPDLQTFRISNNRFNGTIPWQFMWLNNLLNVLLHETDLTGTVPRSICAKRGEKDTGFKADCAPGNDGTIELRCSCCSVCCNPSGKECLPTSSGKR